MSLTPQWLDELRARTTLSTLIGKTIKVQKAGREYKACCPFHNEKTPSFTINDEKGFYHCFGCGAHGDAIRWMTDQRGLPFLDAVKELAAAAGMDVPAPDPRAARRAEKAQSLHDVTAAAQDWFVAQLDGVEGAEARAYLARRGITDATRRAFGLGFAPDSRGRLKDALKAFPPAMLVESGMLIQPEDAGRESYDRFRGRLMIPIRDQRGRVIAFGGRILGSGEPKYLNSPETPLFDKGRTLFNLDKAGPAARKAGRVIVVEGYMDAIMIAQAGIAEAVAPLGTALTEHQIERLWSMVERPLLCFDGDGAGQRAALRAAHRALPLLRPGHSLAFAALPRGQDPDDLIRTAGVAAFEAVLAEAAPLDGLIWRSEHDAAPLETPEARAGFKQRLSALVATIADNDIRALYSRLFRERYDALFFAPRAAQSGTGGAPPRRAQGGRTGGTFRNGRWTPPPPPPEPETRAIGESGGDQLLTRAVLAGLLRFPGEIIVHREALAGLSPADSRLAALLDTLLDVCDREETVETSRLLTILGESDVYNMAKGLLRADALHFTFTRDEADRRRAQRDLAEAIAVIVAMPRIEAELAAVTRAMAEDLDEASYARQQALRKTKADLAARMTELAQPQSD